MLHLWLIPIKPTSSSNIKHAFLMGADGQREYGQDFHKYACRIMGVSNKSCRDSPISVAFDISRHTALQVYCSSHS